MRMSRPGQESASARPSKPRRCRSSAAPTCGAPTTRAAELQRDLQLGVYALAAREVFRFDPLSLSYYYLETGERVTVEKPQDRLLEDRQTILKVADGIRAELFVAKPDRMKCSGCDFRLLCPSSAV